MNLATFEQPIDETEAAGPQLRQPELGHVRKDDRELPQLLHHPRFGVRRGEMKQLTFKGADGRRVGLTQPHRPLNGCGFPANSHHRV
jgi:hypothetical protein